ncbi:glycosyl hydrolase family protein [Striga asiatica]|uniref:Glycosyl hydrolase family protein n=1 Tax=Striga asiatica TaxID=4170 RepID=A0A5A7PD94_STRAF|nr:glycosyl hydrolase family protein [Striga asiatica]
MLAQPTVILFCLLFIQSITTSHGHGHYHVSKPPPQQPCRPPHHDSYAFCNTSLPLKARAQSLISLLTLDEKISQLSDNASAVPRLGIPPYEWWSESLHGIATNGPGVSFNGAVRSATGFPQVILAAAAFNRSLWSAVAAAISVEAKAMHNSGQAGLTFWAPNINVFRDPRWGRGQETPGEDPMVASDFAVEYVRAFQGEYRRVRSWKERHGYGLQRRVLGGSAAADDDEDEEDDHEEDDDRLMLSACCKHFTAYDLEKWGQFTRYNFNAVVTDQDMADTYQAPFKSCIQQGNASCLMCSYNAVNGIPACTNRELLQKARTEWNFKGYITSDCDAVATIYEDQKYTKTPEDAVAAAIKAGTDINCGTYMLRHMKSAVEQGKVLEADIDRALLNLFTVQLRLGIFDDVQGSNPFRNLGPQDVCTEKHRKLALEAVRQGIVLLKNEQKLLPLDTHFVSSLAIIGPLSNSTDLGGGYTGVPCNPISIFQGLEEYVNNVHHATGCQDVSCNSTIDFEQAISVAKQADYVIVVAGLDLSQEREDHDRYSLLLPGHQKELVTALASVSKKPLILILTGGGPLDVSFAAGDSRIASILWIGYPGETAGTAVAEIISGQYNPGGRLPMTWYPESFTSVPMSDMNLRPDPTRNYSGRTYRFYTGDTIYNFGYGLSYTSFTYKLLSAPRKLSLNYSRRRRNMMYYKRGKTVDYVYIDEVPNCSSLRFQVQIGVTNNGDVHGNEVVLLFSKAVTDLKGSPEKQLIGFERIQLLSYEAVETTFVVDPCRHFSFADELGNMVMPTGDHILMSGGLEHVISVNV